jgi:precorrin-6B methylase 2
METEELTLGRKLAPYNPTNLECVTLALNLLRLQQEDLLYDLGCGDGRFLVEVHLSDFSIETLLGFKTIWCSLDWHRV